MKNLVDRAQINEHLLLLVRTRLPDPLCNHCVGAVLFNQHLTLFVDSPSWITRLRFLQESLKQDLAPAGISFQQMRVKAYHALRHNKPAPYSPASLSSNNALLMRQNAKSIEDPLLRDALLRLSSHHKEE